MRFALLAVVLAGAPAASALAQTAAAPAPASVPAATAPASASADDKVVCRHEQEIGSLLAAKKICHTQADWDRMARDSRDQVNEMTLRQNHANGHT